MHAELAAYDPRRTYNAAARDYADASPDYWEFCAQRTVDNLQLPPGATVIDVACGYGPATLRSAEQVGPTGHVTGVDVAEEMLAIARGDAAPRGLENVSLELGSMDNLTYPTESFDAVLCVLGLFFADDIQATARSLWQLVKPGGKLAVTTLGPEFFSPMFQVFLDAARKERPDLDLTIPWKRTENPEQLREIFLAAGAKDAFVVSDDTILPLPSPQEWWRIVRGTGIRRIMMELEPAAAERVRTSNEKWIRRHSLTTLTLGVNYLAARKPNG